MNSASLRRLVADHAALHTIILPPYYLHYGGSSTVTDDLTQLTILLAGPNGTPYENGLWKLHLRIPIDYPNSPPKASFRTKIFHPNVEEATGAVCIDTLKRDWSPHLTLRDILITISCLLINPNPDSALNSAAGKLLQEDFDAFAKKARLMTRIHACIPMEIRPQVAQALTRGEDKDDADDESEYNENDASESKENDPSISPVPVAPTKPIQRNSILGKRPLADLPTPTEPDDEDVMRVTSSERNIAANTTPNLSSTMSNLSFTGVLPGSTTNNPGNSYTTYSFSQRRIVRPHDSNRTAPLPSARIFTFTGISTSSNPEPHGQAGYHHSHSYVSSNKRLRVTEGKENADEEEGQTSDSTDSDSRVEKRLKTTLSTFADSSSPAMSAAPVGLGLGVGLSFGPAVKTGTPSLLLSGSSLATAQAIKARPKARIGLRRL